MDWNIDFISRLDFKKHVEKTIVHYGEKLGWSVNTFLDNYFRKRSAIGCASFTFYH